MQTPMEHNLHALQELQPNETHILEFAFGLMQLPDSTPGLRQLQPRQLSQAIGALTEPVFPSAGFCPFYL